MFPSSKEKNLAVSMVVGKGSGGVVTLEYSRMKVPFPNIELAILIFLYSSSFFSDFVNLFQVLLVFSTYKD